MDGAGMEPTQQVGRLAMWGGEMFYYLGHLHGESLSPAPAELRRRMPVSSFARRELHAAFRENHLDRDASPSAGSAQSIHFVRQHFARREHRPDPGAERVLCRKHRFKDLDKHCDSPEKPDDKRARSFDCREILGDIQEIAAERPEMPAARRAPAAFPPEMPVASPETRADGHETAGKTIGNVTTCSNKAFCDWSKL